MINLDAIQEKRRTILQKMSAAIQANDTEAYNAAFDELCQEIQDNVLERAKQLVGETDSRILSDRGVRQLTSKEKEYYEKLIDAMKSEDPKQAVNNIDVVMPETVIDQVFEDLRTNHPLLSKIDFYGLTGLTRIMMNLNGYQRAAWGKLCAAIVQELTSGFKEVDVTQDKLSAFLPVCKAMLDLGPRWLDSYVREVLFEALANGLEYGIISGTGKDMPIGMMKQVGDNVTVTGGEYPDKAPVKITKLDNIQLGKQAAILAIDENGKARVVRNLILIVNPADYFAKVLPAIQYPAPGGGYVNTLPFEMDIIQSAEVPVGRAVFGMGKRYFLGGGVGNNGRILYSDDYRFLEDERVYLIKAYAAGLAKDNNSFIVLDISGLQPAYYKVENVESVTDVENASLADIKISNNNLSPVFAAETLAYTVETTDASNAITAVPADATAAMEITYNDKVIANGSRITWATGAGNVVKIKVTDGSATKTYEITVTKAEG